MANKETEKFFEYVLEQQHNEAQALNEIRMEVCSIQNPIVRMTLEKGIDDNYNPFHCGGKYYENMLEELCGNNEELYKECLSFANYLYLKYRERI